NRPTPTENFRGRFRSRGRAGSAQRSEQVGAELAPAQRGASSAPTCLRLRCRRDRCVGAVYNSAMTKRVLFGLCAVIAVVCPLRPFAQEREDRTLLSHDQMRAIVSEASGERAMHHVMELVPYPRIRPISEYQGHFRESEVMAGFAREYGFSSVEIESFPTQNRSWAPTLGELWLVTPTEQKKLYD